VPEEAWDIPSTACHRHNLNGGSLRTIDDEIRLDGPEPEGLVGKTLKYVILGTGSTELKAVKRRGIRTLSYRQKYLHY